MKYEAAASMPCSCPSTRHWAFHSLVSAGDFCAKSSGHDVIWVCVQVAKINKFTQGQVGGLKKRLKALRDQVREGKDSKTDQLTQV